ncbi:MAG TPA: diacylglycerol kinase family protein [Gaiellales bacterium]|nr:diacylglycerol kinase family protein [Gaiellales bacterium]
MRTYRTSSVRLAALAALAAAAIAVLMFVLAIFTSPAGVIVGALAVCFAVACGWLALTRSGGVRLLALIGAGVATFAAVVALARGDILWAIAALVASVLAFTTASRSAGRARRRREPRPSRGPERRATSRTARPVLLMNPKSGGGKVERFHLAAEAEKRGIRTIELHLGDDLRSLAAEAIRSAPAIGMAGGDGSQAIVAEVAMRHDVPYVCVPAGTRNHLALDLGLDRDDVVVALDGFTEGVERRIDLALVNGKVFVNNVSLGVYAEIVQSDEYRDAKLRTMERMLPELLGPDAHPLDLRFADGDGVRHDTAQLLMVSNNPYALERMLGAGSRPDLDTGTLGVFAIEIESPAQAAKLFALESTGRARGFGGWLQWSAPTFSVDSSGPIAAGVDGEAMTMAAPLRFESVPGALTVLLPPSAIGVSPAALSAGLSRRGIGELWTAARTGGDAPRAEERRGPAE